MRIYTTYQFKDGWIVGNFEPSLHKDNFEVGIRTYPAGSHHKAHFHKKCREINIVLDGKCQFNQTTCWMNDIIVVEPNEVVDFFAIDKTRILCIKTNSDPKDKFMV